MKKTFLALAAFIACFFTTNESFANYELEYCYCGEDLTYSCHFPDPYGCVTPNIRQCCFDY